MASLTSIRNAIGTNLSNISSLTVYNYMPDSMEPPTAIVGVIETVTYDDTMQRGTDKYIIPIQLIVSRVDAQDSQETLDGYLASSGASSVKAQIESDTSLGGVVSTVRVTEARNYGVYNMNNTDYLGCEFMIEVVG